MAYSNRKRKADHYPRTGGKKRRPYRKRKAKAYYQNKRYKFRRSQAKSLSMAKRLGEQRHKQFFRTIPVQWLDVTASGGKQGVIYFGWDKLKDPSVEIMFRNACVNYEQVRIENCAWHFYIKDSGDQFKADSCQLEMHKMYDHDDIEQPKSLQTLNQGINCKFLRLKSDKHYTMKWYPRWEMSKYRQGQAITPTSSVGIQGARGSDHPWWIPFSERRLKMTRKN